MASLLNTRISDTYVSIIKSIDNAVISSTLKQLSDGSGNALGIYVNTAGDFKVNGILEWGSLKDTGEDITITKFVDEADGIGNNDNDTTIPTSAAVKDYVDTQITAEDLDFAGDTGSGSVDLDSQVLTVSGTANEIETSASGQTLTIGLPSSISVNLVGNVTGDVTGDLTGNVTATSVLADGVTATTQSQGDNSTKIATTSYVDSAIGNNNELSEVLANGNTTGGTDISVSSGDDITFADSSKAIFGAGSDLSIYTNGSTQDRIESLSSFLILEGSNVILRNNGGTEDYAKFFGNSSVELYYNGSKKFETSNVGVAISGNIYLTSGSFVHFDNGGSNDYAIRKQGTTLEFRTGGTYNFLSGNATFASNLILSDYGSGTHTGTATQRLGVDSSGNVIEIPIGAGAVDGAGATGQASFWTDSDTISGDDDFYWDNTNKRLGIGESNPDYPLHISSTLGFPVLIERTNASDAGIRFKDSTTTDADQVRLGAKGDDLQILTGGSESMRIASDGKVFIGKTSTGLANIGVEFDPTGQLKGTASNVVVQYLNRTTSDGAILEFRKDNSAVGSIGSTTSYLNSNLAIGTTSTSYPLTVDTGAGTFSVRAKGGSSVSIASDASLTYFGDTHEFYNSAGDTERMRLDSSGNVGIGVVPESTWYTGGQTRALQIGGTVSIFNLFDTRSVFANNYYLTTDGSDTYINTDEATQYYQEGGQHIWKHAPSGTADTTITWSESMRLDSSGQLALGTTSASSKLHIRVANNTNDVITLDSPSANNILIGGLGTGTTYITSFEGAFEIGNTFSGGDLILKAGNAERLRIDSVGTTTIKTDGTEQLILNRADSSIFANNTIGTIQATADDPTAGQLGGQIQFTGGGTWGTNDYPTNIVFSNDSSGTLTERMRLDSSGQLAIGTTTATAPLTVAGTTDLAWSASTSKLQISRSGSLARLQNYESGSVANLSLQWEGANVGIGESNPQRILHTSGDLVRFDNAGTSAILLLDTTNNEGYRIVTNKDNGAFSIEDMGTATSGAGTERLRIDSSGNINILNATATTSKTIGITNSAGTTGWTFGNGVISNTHQFVIYDNTAGSPRMLINGSGNVGLGQTSAPTNTRLNITGSNDYDLSSSSGMGGIKITGVTAGNGNYTSGIGFAFGSGTAGLTGVQDTGDSDTMGLAFFTHPSSTGSASAEEKMRITSGGRVGIGEDSPQEDVHITGDTPAIRFTDSDTSRDAQIVSIDGNLRFDADNNNAQASTNIAFRTDGTERARITDGGDLLVGTTDNNVTNNSTSGGEGINLGVAGIKGLIGVARWQNAPIYANRMGNDGTAINIGKDGTIVGVIGTQNWGIGTASPTAHNSGRLLHIHNPDGNSAELHLTDNTSGSASTDGSVIHHNASNLYIQNHEAGNIQFYNNGSERARIDSSGNVGFNAIPENSSGTWRNLNFGSLSLAGRSDNTNPDGMIGTNFKFTTANAEQRISAHGTSRIFFDEDVMKFQNAGSDTAGSSITWSERMRITSGGTFCIGGTDRNNGYADNFRTLVVESTATDTASIIELAGTRGVGGNQNGMIHFINKNSSAVETARISGINGASSVNEGALTFMTRTASTSLAEKLRITGEGGILMNTTTTGNGVLRIDFNDAASSPLNYGATITAGRTNSSVAIGFENPNGLVGSIQTSASATSYNTSSDYRLKEDLQDFNALEIASKIKMYDFKWKADDSRSYGVMAHELEEVLPQAVSGKKDGEEMQSVDYSKLVPILLKSIQELEARVKELENK